MSKGQAIVAKAPTKSPAKLRARINRVAAAATHVVFVLAVILIFVRGGEPQATVKDNAPRAGDTASISSEKAPAARLPQALPQAVPQLMPPEQENGNAGEPEPGAQQGLDAQQDDGEFQLAAQSRRSRREREQREEQPAPAEVAQPFPTPPRSQFEQARANTLMARLVATYPDFLSGHDDNNLIWRDGTRMGFDDGQEKSFQERLERPDIEDQFAIPYPLGEMLSDPEPDFDPGRFRNTAFLLKMYGDCRLRGGEVQKKLVDVIWLPKNGAKKIKVTPVNGVAEKLQRISDELDALPADMLKYLRPMGGTFNCRDILNTGRSSAHGFGIAVDLNTAQGDYWEQRGRRSEDRLEYRNRVPQAIVAIFEKYGFIWGGKWYHFDTQHFEYRPELLVADEQAAAGNAVVPMPEKQPRNLN